MKNSCRILPSLNSSMRWDCYKADLMRTRSNDFDQRRNYRDILRYDRLFIYIRWKKWIIIQFQLGFLVRQKFRQIAIFLFLPQRFWRNRKNYSDFREQRILIFFWIRRFHFGTTLRALRGITGREKSPKMVHVCTEFNKSSPN